MDIATLIGIIAGVAVFIFGVASGDYGFAGLKYFFDKPSLIITIFGTLTSVLSSCTLPDFLDGLKSIKLAFKQNKEDEKQIIGSILDLSNVARKEGLLAL